MLNLTTITTQLHQLKVVPVIALDACRGYFTVGRYAGTKWVVGGGDYFSFSGG